MTAPRKPESLTFNLEADAARIVRRAAATLKLPVVELGAGAFRVDLVDAFDAYRLGDLTVTDPDWGRLMFERLRASGPTPPK